MIPDIFAGSVEQYSVFELALAHKTNGNPFTEVTVGAEFSLNGDVFVCLGFYDGNDTFRIRFMPNKPGNWIYLVKSNVKQLDGQKGSFTCIPCTGNNHGKVSVRETFDFGYADGTP